MRTHKNNVSLALALMLLAIAGTSYAGEYQASRVIDGDTIEAKKGDTKIKIRLVGIDAPEKSKKKNQPGQPYSQQASRHLNSLVLGRTVDVKTYGTDRNGRALSEIYLDGKNINLEMVKAGLAEAYRGKSAPGHDTRPYREAEEKARKAGKGIWSQADKYMSPKEWRKKHPE